MIRLMKLPLKKVWARVRLKLQFSLFAVGVFFLRCPVWDSLRN